MRIWTKKELDLFGEYKFVREVLDNEVRPDKEEYKTENLLKRRFFIEAQLLIINKYVVAYIGKGAGYEYNGIFTFDEAIELEQKYSKDLFNFHPINFMTKDEYIKYYSSYE